MVEVSFRSGKWSYQLNSQEEDEIVQDRTSSQCTHLEVKILAMNTRFHISSCNLWSLLALVICGSFLLVITLSWNHMLQSVIAGVNGSLPWQPTPHFRDSTLGRTSDRPRSRWDRLRITWSNSQLTNTQVSSMCCMNWTLKPQILDPNTWVFCSHENMGERQRRLWMTFTIVLTYVQEKSGL
jgi:hypothetical protein